MGVAKITILSNDEIEAVHAKTLELLVDPGIRIRSERALKLLEDGGAAIDRKGMRASLPESLVKETVK